MKNMGLQIDPLVKDRLREIAKAKRLSLSAVVRIILEDWVQRRAAEQSKVLDIDILK